jgi:hypothetical protein
LFLKPRLVFLWEQKVNAVVNGHHQPGSWKERGLVMRDVENVDPVPPQQGWNGPVIDPETISLGLVQLPEIPRQRSKFVKMTLCADQKIFILSVERGDVADEVPDVGSNPEFIDLPDVDRNSHRKYGVRPLVAEFPELRNFRN